MFVKKQFLAVQAVLPIAQAKSTYSSVKLGSTVTAAGVDASPHLVLNVSL